MDKMVWGPSTSAQWQQLLQEAQALQAGQAPLTEELESYLVFLLMRFTACPHFFDTRMAIDYLESQQKSPSQRADQLRDVGDKCLLLSGLFPNHAEKRCVSVGYFVRIGKSAYGCLSEHSSHCLGKLYELLAHDFVKLMDVLLAVRQLDTHHHPLLEPLQAEALWRETRSQQALNTLRTHSPEGHFTTPLTEQKRPLH